MRGGRQAERHQRRNRPRPLQASTPAQPRPQRPAASGQSRRRGEWLVPRGPVIALHRARARAWRWRNLARPSLPGAPAPSTSRVARPQVVATGIDASGISRTMEWVSGHRPIRRHPARESASARVATARGRLHMVPRRGSRYVRGRHPRRHGARRAVRPREVRHRRHDRRAPVWRIIVQRAIQRGT